MQGVVCSENTDVEKVVAATAACIAASESMDLEKVVAATAAGAHFAVRGFDNNSTR